MSTDTTGSAVVDDRSSSRQVSVVARTGKERDPEVVITITDLKGEKALSAQISGEAALKLGTALSTGGMWVHRQEQEAQRE